MKADFNQWTGSAFNKTAGVDFSMQMGDGTDPLSAYDANGNILNMQLMGLYKGASIKIDSLVYTYQNNASNKLAKVSDGSTAVTNGLGDFKDGTNVGDDYGYDANGNLNLDNNKKISAIAYNYLNLPDTMTITSKGTVAYVYDAKGTKLQKITTDTTVHPTKITTTSYDESGFQYVNNTLQFLGQEEGRIRFVPTIGTTEQHFAFDYFLKDQLGNTRMVLTDENSNETIPKLTMELVDTTVNCQYFSNLSSTRAIKPNNFNCQLYAAYPDTISYAAKITGIDTAFIGPFAARRIMNGDSISIKVESYYRTHDNNASLQPALTAEQSNAALLKQVVYGLVQDGQGSTVTQLLADTVLQNSVTNYLTGISVAGGKPQAGVYWLNLDNQLHLVSNGSGFQQVGNGGCGVLKPTIPKATSNGYIFVFIGNQTPQLFVYYDNLQMQHEHSPVLEETTYYPSGLIAAGISSKSGKPENKYKFGGKELQSAEFSDGSGLDEYDFGARGYGPQKMRFDQTDLHAENSRRWSPYVYGYNNPVRFIDPDGMDGKDATNEKDIEHGVDRNNIDNADGEAACAGCKIPDPNLNNSWNPLNEDLNHIDKEKQNKDDNDPREKPHYIAQNYTPPPKNGLPGFPNAGKGSYNKDSNRWRWYDKDGSILEWDKQHGKVEKYNKNGQHQGAYDPNTGEMIKDPVKGTQINKATGSTLSDGVSIGVGIYIGLKVVEGVATVLSGGLLGWTLAF